MATQGNRVDVEIKAKVEGQESVSELADRLEDVAKVLEGEVKEQAEQAARELRELGEQQAAIQAFERLTREARDTQAALKGLESEAAAYGREIALAGAPTAAQAAHLQRLDAAAEAVRVELGRQKEALAGAGAELNRYGVATQNTQAAKQRLAQAEARVRERVQAIAPAYQRTGAAAAAAGQQQQAANRQAATSLEDISQRLKLVQSLYLAFLGGNQATALIGDLAATADAYNSLAARIQLVTGEGAAFTAAMEGVQRIAVATRSDLEATGTLYTKLAEAGKSLGLSQQQALGLTETINQAMQLSGGSAESAKAAIIQLVQGLQSGVVRGEEFNSIMEQSPRLATALADGLGVAKGELRKMAEQGQLTSETVINSLRGQTDVVASEFAKLPPTVGGALQNLSTAWTVYVGNVDKASGASRAAAEAINVLSENLEGIGGVLATAGKGAAALLALNLARQFADWALGAKAAAAAATTTTAATTGHTTAVNLNTVALEANTAAKARNAGAGLVGALTAQQQAAKGNAQALGEMAGALGRVGPAATAAGGAVAQAANKGGLLARSAAVMGAGFRGLTALLGGPVGLLALTAVYAKDLGELAAKAVLWVKGQDNLEQSTRKAAEAERAAAEAATARAAQLEQQRLAAERATQASFNLSRAGLAQVNALVELQKKGELTDEVIANIGKDFDLSSAVGIQNAGTVLDALLQKGVITSDQFKAAWAKALDGQDLTTFGFKAQEAFGTAGRGVEQLAMAMDARLAAAVQRTGVELAGFTGGMGAAATRAVGDIDTVIGGMDRLRAQGLDVAAVLTASIGKGINTADSQEAIEAVRARIEEVRRALGDTVANGLLDQARQKAEALRGALEDAKPGIQSTAEAMRVLGVTTQASLDAAASKARTAYETIRNSGTATTRELQQAFAAYAKTAIEANGGVATEALKLEAALRGVAISGGQAGGAIVSGMNAAADATRRAADEMQRMQALSSQRGPAGGTRSYDNQGNRLEADGSPVGKWGAVGKSEPYGIQGYSGWSNPYKDPIFRALVGSRVRFTKANGRGVAMPGAAGWMPSTSAAPASASSSVAAPPAAPRATTTPVNVSINGANRQINTASQQDAYALAEMLKQLDAMSRRAAI